MFSGIYCFPLPTIDLWDKLLSPFIRNKKGNFSVWNLDRHRLLGTLLKNTEPLTLLKTKNEGRGPVFPLSSACPGPTEGQQRPEKKAWASQGDGVFMKGDCRQFFHNILLLQTAKHAILVSLWVSKFFRMIEILLSKSMGKVSSLMT